MVPGTHILAPGQGMKEHAKAFKNLKLGYDVPIL